MKSKIRSEILSNISWERLRLIFNNPRPPLTVTERQFDYLDEKLHKLAATPWEEIDFSDLWYYFHDLAYSNLQPELFNYLFPVCLMDWHETLMKNESCSHGDSEFHYGVFHGNVFTKMLSPKQSAYVFDFFRDSFLVRVDQERGLDYVKPTTLTYSWLRRFNSLGLIMPRIDLLWDAWWSLDTPGRAVAAIQYLAGLAYLKGENHLCSRGRSEPCLWGNDSLINEAGWMPRNVQFLQEKMTVNFAIDKMNAAVERLKDQSESDLALRVRNDFQERLEIVEERVRELPRLLSDPSSDEWSV